VSADATSQRARRISASEHNSPQAAIVCRRSEQRQSSGRRETLQAVGRQQEIPSRLLCASVQTHVRPPLCSRGGKCACAEERCAKLIQACAGSASVESARTGTADSNQQSARLLRRPRAKIQDAVEQARSTEYTRIVAPVDGSSPSGPRNPGNTSRRTTVDGLSCLWMTSGNAISRRRSFQKHAPGTQWNPSRAYGRTYTAIRQYRGATGAVFTCCSEMQPALCEGVSAGACQRPG